MQFKTKQPLTLPLFEDVGNAVIDYLRNGRPESPVPNIFIRHRVPYSAFNENNRLHHMLNTYIYKAGIVVTPEKSHGMHTLRHSLATELLKKEVPLPVISEILGHQRVETTANYLRVDTEQLRNCTLSMQAKEKDYKFTSGLSQWIIGFLEEKHRLGYKYEREYFELKNLDRFSIDYNCMDRLPRELVLAWTQRQANHSPQTIRSKVNLIRQLAMFMSRNGCEVYLYPSSMIPKKTYEHIPYIFSHDEVRRVFKTIDSLSPSCFSVRRHLIFPLLFRLLYCCGLRVSEALNLRVSDIDFEHGVIFIHDAKDYRDRLIPLNQDLCQRCMNYKEHVLSELNPEGYFFPAPDGLTYHIFTIRKTFRDILWNSGISYGGRNVGPRLHDLRHTFAVHSLQKLLEEGKRPAEVLPILSTYMGHKTYKGTSKYLHLTSELYPEILEKMEAAFGGLLPERMEADEQTD